MHFVEEEEAEGMVRKAGNTDMVEGMGFEVARVVSMDKGIVRGDIQGEQDAERGHKLGLVEVRRLLHT